MTNPIIVDLSHWNQGIDFDMLKANGTEGVILKATEGSTYVDDTYNARYLDATEAGLYVSSYHFLRHGNVEEQMHHYLSTVQPEDGERLCLDYETVEGQPRPTLDDLHEAVHILRREVPTCNIAIYSGHLIKEDLGDDYDEVLASTSLWIAHYTETSEPDWPQGTWRDWDVWQYTDRALVVGVADPCDGNRWGGSREGLAEWFGWARPHDQIVTISVTLPKGVDVALVVNGERLV